VTENTTVATLIGSSVRLVVFKFLVRSSFVPDCIPRLPINRSGVMPAARGREVLLATPDVWLAGLQASLLRGPDYFFVGARDDERGDGRSDVRFTFCHRQHLNDTPSHPIFIVRFQSLLESFVDFTKSNLWTLMGFINPYLNEDSTTGTGKGRVLMLDCNARKPLFNSDGSLAMVYEGGREKPIMPGGISRGIGSKVPLFKKAVQLQLIGKKIRLVSPLACG